jgi:hypothetical protein
LLVLMMDVVLAAVRFRTTLGHLQHARDGPKKALQFYSKNRVGMGGEHHPFQLSPESVERMVSMVDWYNDEAMHAVHGALQLEATMAAVQEGKPVDVLFVGPYFFHKVLCLTNCTTEGKVDASKVADIVAEPGTPAVNENVAKAMLRFQKRWDDLPLYGDAKLFGSGRNVTHVYMIVNEAGCHWTGMHVDLSNKRIEYLDSLAKGVSYKLPLYLMQLAEACFIKMEEVEEGRSSEGTWKLSTPRLPQQQDMHNYGPYVLQFMDSISHHKRPTSTSFADNCRSLRKKLLWNVHNLVCSPEHAMYTTSRRQHRQGGAPYA